MDTVVEKYIKDDRRKADLQSKLGMERPSGRIPNSGMGEEDYRTLDGFGMQLFRQLSYQPFPAEIQDQYKRMQSNFLTGLLPTISRAWVSVDCDLFLWNFESSCDIVSFDKIESTILAVGVTTPRAAFPRPQPNRVLVVGTTTHILLIGLNFLEERTGQAVPEDFNNFRSPSVKMTGRVLLKIPLGGEIINNLCCSTDGRIFFSAGDHLYEVDYWSKTWYGASKCAVVNHTKSRLNSILPVLSAFYTKDDVRQLQIDDTRHLLYLLLEHGGVQVFDLGAEGNTMQKFAGMRREEIENYVTRDCNVAGEFFRDIIGLCVVPTTQSSSLNFFVITSKGVRIYFTCSDPADPSIGYNRQEQARPRHLAVAYVRFPPPNPFFSTRDIGVYTAHFSRDAYFMANSRGDNQQTTLRVFSSYKLWKLPSVEYTTALSMKSNIWEIKGESRRSAEAPLAVCPVPRPQGTSILEHLARRSNEFFILSSKGVYTYTHISAYELFREILTNFGPESKQFKRMLNCLDRAEVCFLALSLLCSSDPSDYAINDLALRIFFGYGGEPHTEEVSGRQTTTAYQTPLQSSAPHPDSTAANISLAALSSLRGGAPLSTSTPQQAQNGVHTPLGPLVRHSFPTPATTTIVPSARHEALFSYFARIVGGIWDREVCYTASSSMTYSSVSAEEVRDIALYLSTFLRTFEDYPLISPTPSQYSLMTDKSRHIVDSREENLLENERQSLLKLQTTSKLTLEVVRLWGVLLDHQFHTIVSAMPAEIRNLLLHITFGELVERRGEFCAELITSLMHFYISDEASTSSISNRLRDSCPSLFTRDDAMVVKATDTLHKSKSIHSAKDRDRLVGEAVSTLQKSIQMQDIVAVCDLLLQVHNYLGIVDLALARAEKDDPNQRALNDYKKEGMDAMDSTRNAVKRRNEAYNCIVEVLFLLWTVESREPGSQTFQHLAAESIFISADSVKSLTPEEAEAHRYSVLRRVFDSDDELANVAVFRWLLDNHLWQVPIELNCRFFEAFLCHEISEGKVEYLDLLWKFHEKNGNYTAAAKTLYEIATRNGRSSLTLSERISYLSHALMSIQAAEASRSNLELRTQISDQLDVARVQQKARLGIESRAGTPFERRDKEAIDALDSYLYNLTDLYEIFAEPFDLADVKKAIVLCAGVENDALFH